MTAEQLTGGPPGDVSVPPAEGWHSAIVHGEPADGLLGRFNRAGVLGPAEVHTARRLGILGGEDDPLVLLAVALAVRAPRVGHVSVRLGDVRHVVSADTDLGGDADLDALPWPDPVAWYDRVAASPLVAVMTEAGVTEAGVAAGALRQVGAEDVDRARPLRLEGPGLYLDRYWRDELTVAGELLRRTGIEPDAAAVVGLEAAVAAVWGDPATDQAAAAATIARRNFAVIAGGPGTGKTTTVARTLAVLHLQAVARGVRPPLVALAAPTGKAAARLEEAVRAEAATMVTVDPATRGRLSALAGTTLHRLLGSRPGSTRLRYHAGHRLPHDVVVVDEASMVSLGLMARLVEAVRPDARLVLVGDPEQLVSVEAGAVLADIAGPALASDGIPTTGGPAGAPDLGGASHRAGAPGASRPGGRLAQVAASIAVLDTTHRFGGVLAELAAAVRTGHADRVTDVLGRGDPALRWVAATGELSEPDAIERLPGLVDWTSEVTDAARGGRRAEALAALGRHRILCAHRRGPAGASAWNAAVDGWLAAARPDLAAEGSWYAGRPVIVTGNDYGLRLFNGDTGVAVAACAGGPVDVAFAGPNGEPRLVGPSRLSAVETVWAMTVHKAQGSEFDAVTLLLPPEGSRLLTRELLYTAVTRARLRLTLVGSEEAVAAAVTRPIARASGLTERLWGRP